MAFVCTLSPHEPLLLTGLKSEEGQGETIVRIPIGYDDDTNAIYSAFVCLATVPGYGPLRHELVFHVVWATDEDEHFTSDGSETRHVITDPAHRHLILDVICLATNVLIDEVAPVEVELITHTPHLPQKALVKYWAIGNVLLGKGYVPAHPDPFHGREIWMFTQP